MLYNLINFNSWAQFFAMWGYFTLMDISLFMMAAAIIINKGAKHGNRSAKKSHG